MAYDPRNYIRERGRNVRQFGANIGAAVANLPGEIRAEREYKEKNRLREEAIKEAKEDWSTIENNWKTMRTTYTKQARPLVQQGLMTEEEYNSNLKRMVMPVKADKKDPGRYLDNLAKSSRELFADAKTRLQQAKLGGQIAGLQGPQRGTPQEPQPTEEAPMMGPERPPGQTFDPTTNQPPYEAPVEEQPVEQPVQPTRERMSKEDYAQAMAEKGIFPTKEQREQNFQLETAPTEADLEKMKLKQAKEVRLQEKNDYQDAMMALRWARENRLQEHGKIKMQLAEDRAKQASSRLIGRTKADIEKAKQELGDLKKGSENLMGEVEIDWDAIADKETEITNLEDIKSAYDAERKMIGAMPGEQRKFSGSGKQTQPSRTRGGGY